MPVLGRLLFLISFMLLPCLVHGLWNKKRYAIGCKPARDCAEENVCYCSNKFDGWKNGGMAPYTQTEGAFCSKNGRDCECEDCGYWFAPGDQCQEIRCNDDVGIVENEVCYHIDSSTGQKTKRDFDWEFDCYKTKVMCNSTLTCNYAQQLTGCKRYSPGTCAACPSLAEGFFWGKKGSCEQKRCTAVGPGKFLGKACTATTDSVISECRVHPGNTGYVVPRQDGRSTYYCPGNGLVLPLPENSQPTADFSAYECLPGFYQEGASCLQCAPGFACKYGRKFECPEHYYSSTFGMSYCTLCTRQCGSQWQHPLRCAQGSTANPGCVSCGACDYNPRRGMSCVMEAYEMQGLPDTCTPADLQGGSVAVCQ